MTHIGIDFDNTIVCYDDVFHKVAVEEGLIPEGPIQTKTEIRNYFRSIQKEEEWTRLQGLVYGARLDLARPFPGVEAFFSYCRQNQITISIISHKTRYPYLGPPYDLHRAATQWLQNQPFYSNDIHLHFELTLKEKMERIRQSECDYFVDDLPELLGEPSFPSKPKKVLFDPSIFYPKNPQWITIQSWNQLYLIFAKFQPS